MSEIDQELNGAIARAEKAFGDITNLGPEIYAKRLGALPNSTLANDILEDYKKDFKGNLQDQLNLAGIKEGDSALLQIYKLHEYERRDKLKSSKKSTGK
ncbi:MAG: hypothetical protein P0S95_08430 [Rhabdochlamydiaceae bacterium]|nr:hypothetical protein [Candidatus Amphrikana amoebophyrae]